MVVELEVFFVWRTGKPMVAIDRKDCFDKICWCPILISLPTTEKDIYVLNKKIEFLKTDEGYKLSKNFESV